MRKGRGKKGKPNSGTLCGWAREGGKEKKKKNLSSSSLDVQAEKGGELVLRKKKKNRKESFENRFSLHSLGKERRGKVKIAHIIMRSDGEEKVWGRWGKASAPLPSLLQGGKEREGGNLLLLGREKCHGKGKETGSLSLSVTTTKKGGKRSYISNGTDMGAKRERRKKEKDASGDFLDASDRGREKKGEENLSRQCMGEGGSGTEGEERRKERLVPLGSRRKEEKKGGCLTT